MANIPVEDENDYGARQWGMETAGDDWIEDLEVRKREEEYGPGFVSIDGNEEDSERRPPAAVGESKDFRVKFAQPCFACRNVILVGEMARGRKRERGWDLFHPTCPLA